MVGGLCGAIIAAGRGERLRNAVDDLPKPLVELGSETMLVRQARMLHEAGAETVVALVNSETAGLIAARGITTAPWLKLRVRDTPRSMESVFTLGEYLRGGGHFLLSPAGRGGCAAGRTFCLPPSTRSLTRPSCGASPGARWN